MSQKFLLRMTVGSDERLIWWLTHHHMVQLLCGMHSGQYMECSADSTSWNKTRVQPQGHFEIIQQPTHARQAYFQNIHPLLHSLCYSDCKQKGSLLSDPFNLDIFSQHKMRGGTLGKGGDLEKEENKGQRYICVTIIWVPSKTLFYSTVATVVAVYIFNVNREFSVYQVM